MGELPGIYSNYTTDDGRVSVYARFAAFDEGADPIKAFVFNAKSYTVEGIEVTPIKEQHDKTQHQQHQNLVAEYIGPTTSNEIEETGVIFYHFEEFDGLCKQERIVPGEYEEAVTDEEIPPLPSFTDFYILSELHELCHWAIPIDEQPEDGKHSYIWNALLSTFSSHGSASSERNPDFAYSFNSVEETPVTVPDLEMKHPRDVDREETQLHIATADTDATTPEDASSNQSGE